MTESIDLCQLDEIPLQSTRGFDPFNEGRDTVFVVNTQQGPLAYKDLCPHYGDTSLPWRKNTYLNSAGTKIICAAHGAEFEIDTGLCISGPCLGQSLISVPINISEDGLITVSVLRPTYIKGTNLE